jgi:hypothetical protein
MIKKFSLMEEYFKESTIIDTRLSIARINTCKYILEQLESESYDTLGFSEYYEKYPFPDDGNFLEYLNRERTEEDSNLFKKCYELSIKLQEEYFNEFIANFRHYREWWD